MQKATPKHYRTRIFVQSQLRVRAMTGFLFSVVVKNTDFRPICLVIGCDILIFRIIETLKVELPNPPGFSSTLARSETNENISQDQKSIDPSRFITNWSDFRHQSGISYKILYGLIRQYTMPIMRMVSEGLRFNYIWSDFVGNLFDFYIEDASRHQGVMSVSHARFG